MRVRRHDAGTMLDAASHTGVALDGGDAAMPAVSRGVRLAARLAGAAPDLVEALTTIATAASAHDEVARGVAALAGSDWEIARNRPRQLERVTVFMPSNNVLYAYVLFGLIPALYSDTVIVRPSSRVRETTTRVHELLSAALDGLGAGSIVLSDASQRAFARSCRDADAVVFTGQFENSLAIGAAIGPRARLLRFGSGPNPIVVGEQADIERAVGDALGARLYNSGQDCLCPDAIFVHEQVRSAFVEQLVERVAAISVGDRRHPDTLVAPMVYADAVEGAHAFLAAHAEHVVRGGRVDVERGIVEPTVVVRPFDDAFHPPELFSPIFCVVPYRSCAQLDAWLHSPTEMERGMYASIYGETSFTGRTVGTSVVCREQTTFDAEDGNVPFGGFGERSSSVVRDGRSSSRPLLLSNEMSRE
jgi:acyl-CoA reductase-like NAD-dependent aldehyde dehydrogenase